MKPINVMVHTVSVLMMIKRFMWLIGVIIVFWNASVKQGMVKLWQVEMKEKTMIN
jgi:hypothetical protein